MDKSRIFFVVLFVLLFASIAATYYRYVIREDYVIYINAEEVPDVFDVTNYQQL